MKRLITTLTYITPASTVLHIALLVFRIAVSIELVLAHGLKKLGIGVATAEVVPNPLHLPETINNAFAIAGNLVFPWLVMLGLFTRLAILPILAITLTGYFVVHWHDSLLEKDTPFMYSISFIFLWVVGPGKYSLDNLIYQRFQRNSSSF